MVKGMRVKVVGRGGGLGLLPASAPHQTTEGVGPCALSANERPVTD